jgi:general secretion pathway protein M
MTLPTGPRGQFVAVALVVIVLLLGYQFVVLPTLGAYQARAEAIEDRQLAVRRYRQLLSQAPRLAEFNARYEELRPVDGLLLPGDNPALSGAALQQRLQDLAGQYGVRILSLRIRPAETDAPFERIPVEIRLQTDTPGLSNLLYEIDRSTPYLFVESLSLRTRPQRRGNSRSRSGDVIDGRMVVYGLRSPVLAALGDTTR